MAAVTAVIRAVPICELQRQIHREGHAIECQVVGTTPDSTFTGLEIDRGSFLTATDSTAAQNRVIISSEVIWILFSEEDPVGKPVKFRSDYYTVFGIVKQAKDLKGNVYMLSMTYRLRFGERISNNHSGMHKAIEMQLSRLILEVCKGTDVEATTTLIKCTLQPYHPKGDVEVVIIKSDRKTRQASSARFITVFDPVIYYG